MPNVIFHSRLLSEGRPAMQGVLIVEDNEDLRGLYKLALKFGGYDAVMATNGREALEMLYGTLQKPKLIILDLMMPVMDGWEFLKERAKDEVLRGIPVVICSATKERLPESVPFLRKPVELDALLAVVEEHLK